MKIIDQTPLLDANGQLSLVNRIQGMLKYGFSWPANLEAQEIVIAQMNKVIEKGYTLFRNQQLGASEIIVPLIVIGNSGIYAMDATPLKGMYQARGDEWGTLSNGRFMPASINILSRTARLAMILQLFFERQGLKIMSPVEPVLLASNPGLHIESVRPAVRPVMSDAIDRFAASLLTARPIYSTTDVNEFIERLQHPRSAQQAQQPSAPPEDVFSMKDERPFEEGEPSRLQTILNSPKSDALIESNPSDVSFALEDEPSPTVMVSNPYQRKEAAPPSGASPKPGGSRRILGMTLAQLLLLGILLVVEFAVLAGFALLMLRTR
jgi:hypothetical protein